MLLSCVNLCWGTEQFCWKKVIDSFSLCCVSILHIFCISLSLSLSKEKSYLQFFRCTILGSPNKCNYIALYTQFLLKINHTITNSLTNYQFILICMCEYNSLCDSLQMKECNKLLWFNLQDTLRSEGLWSLILNHALMSSSWMSSWTYLIWCEGRWLDLDLNWRKIPILILKSRNELGFLGSKDALLDLEMTLYFDKVSIGFFSLSFCPPFSHIRNLYLRET